ncbi:hypothetical protein [Thalassobacillus hwangdonensis]|uniref:Lipoprotein n=1 Tax=Thalassobacillus hwangdonensis TaxID=546108 RepID=A0ABW3KUQ0_9BACI
MRKWFVIVMTAFLFGCQSEAEVSGNESEASQLADEMVITQAVGERFAEDNFNMEWVEELEVELENQKLLLIIQSNKRVTSDDFLPAVEAFLRDVSEATVGSDPMTDGFGTIYDKYDVKVTIKEEHDTHIGEMSKGIQSMQWSLIQK